VRALRAWARRQRCKKKTGRPAGADDPVPWLVFFTHTASSAAPDEKQYARQRSMAGSSDRKIQRSFNDLQKAVMAIPKPVPHAVRRARQWL
jgi:hypothetical protein